MATLSVPDINPFVVLAVFAIAYVVGGAIYRLYFSPIAKFPGPKLAALTYWYEFYYDVIKDGQYIFKIGELHKQYGPIVRICPDELHISDPDYYEQVYSRSSRREKSKRYCNHFKIPDSAFETIDHDLHRLRRRALNTYFSKQKAVGQESLIQQKLEKLCQRLRTLREAGTVVDLRLVYMCLVADTNTEYALGWSYNYLDDPDFSPQTRAVMVEHRRMGHLMRHFPWMTPLRNRLPDWFVPWTNIGTDPLNEFQKEAASQLQRRMDEKDKHPQEKAQQTLLEELLRSNLPPEEKTYNRIWQDFQTIVGVGEELPNALVVISFHLIANPDKLARLKAELETAIPDPDAPAKWQELEKLPYLSAVISEGLRLSYGITTRLPRIAPDQVLQYNDWAIPPGTAMSMSSVIMHHNEDIFPNSHEFLPERWLEQSEGKRLDKYLVTFGRGSRQCLAMNLSYAEMYLFIGTLFRRFDMELFETARDDVDMAYDWYAPHAKKDTKGVRVYIK